MIARPRLTVGWIDGRVIYNVQLDRIDLQRVSQFIQRRLQSKGAWRLAGSAHRRWCGDVDVQQVVRRRHVRTGVHDTAGVGAARLNVFTDWRSLLCSDVTDGCQLTVFRRRHCQLLFRRGPVPGADEHLSARYRQLHGPADDFRRGRREHRMGPSKALAAEAAAHIGTDDVDLVARQAEHLGENGLRPLDPLRRVINGEMIAFPNGQCAGRRHRIVRLDGGRISLLDLDGFGIGQRFVHVAAMIL